MVAVSQTPVVLSASVSLASGRRTRSKRTVPPQAVASSVAPAPWRPLRLPRTPQELVEAATSEEARALLASPQSLGYLAYSAARAAFFTTTAIATAAATGSGSLGAERLDRQGAAVSSGQQNVRNGISPDGLAAVLSSQAELYRQELEHIKAGLYRTPYDSDPRHRQWNPAYVADKAARLLRVSRETRERRGMADGGHDLMNTVTDAAVLERDSVSDAHSSDSSVSFKYPEYFLANFHYQTDGWMSVRSALSYEFATETLFQGCQDAMQRAALVPIARHLAGRDVSQMTLLEVAAGTGRVHTFVKDNWPQMRTICTDMSPYYLAEARENIEYFSEFNGIVNAGRRLAPTRFVQAAAEALPFADASVDVLLNVYLFHELPAEVRAAAIAEFARVTKPGGLVVINDSLQRGDRPEIDSVMHLFPENYHEPYYMNYVDTDVAQIFLDNGMEAVSCDLAHVSKVWAFRKPMAAHSAEAPVVHAAEEPVVHAAATPAEAETA